MNWEAVGAIAETLGAVATIVMLVYLSVQIRQNTYSQKTSAFQAANSEVARLLQTSRDDYLNLQSDELTDDEKAIGYNWFASFFTVYEVMYYIHVEGGVDSEIWESREDQIKIFLSSQFGKDFWGERKKWFAKSFRTHVDMLIGGDV
jgi:hypothetical protein